MAEFLILRAIAAQLIREPLTWLCAAALVLLWWGLEVFMPLGLSTDAFHRSTAHYELAFLGGTIALLMAVGPCLKMRHMLLGRAMGRALLADLLALVFAAACMGAVVVVPAEAFQLWQLAEFPTGAALGALLLGWLHMASMVAVIPLRWPMARSESASGAGIRDKVTGAAWIAFATLVIPATQSGHSITGQGLLQIFDPGRLLRMCLRGQVPDAPTWALAGLAVGAWCMLALGLSRTTSPSLH